MDLKLTISALIFAACFVGVSAQCGADSPYLKLSATHTMCQPDKGKNMPLSDADKKNILDRHNEARRVVDPPAANMQKLVWNDDLAKTAAKLARLCTRDHDTYDNRREPSMPGVSIGQNIASSSDYSGMDSAFSNSFKMGWLDEKADFTYGVSTSKTVGHYTQMITADTVLIGCGMADCSSVDTFVQHKVCNYAPGQTTYVTPYTKSDNACSGCAGKCENKLCDCSGKLCLNGGKLNLSKCNCRCLGIFSGDTCEKKSCAADSDLCPLYWEQNPNVDLCSMPDIQGICPNRCNLCG